MSWDTTRGLLTDYRGTIQNARFKFDPRYNDGQTLLMEFTVATNNSETPSTTESLPVGSGWTTEDGNKAFRKDGGDKFNRTAWYGMLIETVKADPDAVNAIKDKGDPTDASIWVGTTWDFEEATVDYGGEIGEKSRTMPVRFVGVGEVDNPPAQSGGAPESNGEVMDKLKALANSAADHSTFVREALQVDGVHAIIDQVADESDKGLYAKLKE